MKLKMTYTYYTCPDGGCHAYDTYLVEGACPYCGSELASDNKQIPIRNKMAKGEKYPGFPEDDDYFHIKWNYDELTRLQKRKVRRKLLLFRYDLPMMECTPIKTVLSRAYMMHPKTNEARMRTDEAAVRYFRSIGEIS